MKARIMDNPHIMSLLHSSLAATCTAEQSARLLDAYGLAGELKPEQQYVGMQQLASDLRFYFPVLEICEGWGDKAWRYHFHQVRILPPSPFPSFRLMHRSSTNNQSKTPSEAPTKPSHPTN